MNGDAWISVPIEVSKAKRRLVITQGEQRIVLDVNTANQLDMELWCFLCETSDFASLYEARLCS